MEFCHRVASHNYSWGLEKSQEAPYQHRLLINLSMHNLQVPLDSCDYVVDFESKATTALEPNFASSGWKVRTTDVISLDTSPFVLFLSHPHVDPHYLTLTPARTLCNFLGRRRVERLGTRFLPPFHRPVSSSLSYRVTKLLHLLKILTLRQRAHVPFLTD